MTTDTKSPARVFWLVETKNCLFIYDDELTAKKEAASQASAHGEVVAFRVIDYHSYAAAVEECERLRDASKLFSSFVSTDRWVDWKRIQDAERECARLGAEVEELMKVDYWQDRYKIEVKAHGETKRELETCQLEYAEEERPMTPEEALAFDAEMAAIAETPEFKAQIAEIVRIQQEKPMLRKQVNELQTELTAERERNALLVEALVKIANPQPFNRGDKVALILSIDGYERLAREVLAASKGET